VTFVDLQELPVIRLSGYYYVFVHLVLYFGFQTYTFLLEQAYKNRRRAPRWAGNIVFSLQSTCQHGNFLPVLSFRTSFWNLGSILIRVRSLVRVVCIFVFVFFRAKGHFSNTY